MTSLNRKILIKLYQKDKLSTRQIAKKLHCSENKVNYWMNKFEIKKRTISDALYLSKNPKGDPFRVAKVSKKGQSFLFGLGLGLYWGEGNKRNKTSVRFANTDPAMVVKFLEFLEEIYSIDRKKIKCGIQVFNTMNPIDVLSFWSKELGLPKGQFQKVVITPSRGKGSYTKKIQHGVLTIYFNNKKLRDIICNEIGNL